MLIHKYLLIILILFFVSPAAFAQSDTVRQLDAPQFNRILHLNSKARCIDVRLHKAFLKEHIKGAYSAETSDILFHLIDSLGTDKVYLLYCKYGERSLMAGKLIYKKRGIHVLSMEYGLDDWKASGFTLVK
ncbi:rhodanese-like domain-containing protein [Ancylomarina longa]|uniref:Rhodanese-like domain-containing protein n=1 Tax=Ancylomarina longa TaxID=2487017 RepID=A0A434AWJ3_9BACT|nr:rhodanese-like domain-containing protein [Ancylomarina longa]RUT78852.1 rhodanese-like domain-containing protein [Ancylomarina longa]